MAEVQESWREVVSRTEALGHKLKLHLGESDATAEEPPTGDGDQEGEAATTASDSTASDSTASDSTAGDTEDGTSKRETRAALDDLGHRLQDVFESFGAAVKDPTVRTEIKDIGVALKDALLTTLTTVGSEVSDKVSGVSDRVKKTGSDETGDAGADEPADTIAPGPDIAAPSSGDADASGTTDDVV